MYVVAGAATIMTALCLEAMHFFHRYIAEKVVEVTLSSTGGADQLAVLERLKEENLKLESYSVSEGKIHLSLRMRQKDYMETLRKFVHKLEGFTIEDLY